MICPPCTSYITVDRDFIFISGCYTAMLVTIVMLAITLVSANNSSLSVIRIQYTSCGFYFNSAQPQAPFRFHFCALDNQQIHTWLTCLDRCCPQMPPGNHTASEEAIRTCQGQNSGFSLLIMVVIISLGCTCAVGIIICLICACCRLKRTSNSVIQDRQNTQADTQQNQWEGEEINLKNLQIQWSSKSSPLQRLPALEDPCTICLEGSTTVELFCKHQFHPKCIGGWLRKSQGCPCCRHLIKGAKVFCQLCRWQYFVSQKKLLAKSGKKLPSKCQQCIESILFTQSNHNNREADSGMKVQLQQSEQIFEFNIER